MSSTIFRTYAPHECGRDGYPTAWHRLEEAEFRRWAEEDDRWVPDFPYEPLGVKDIVRMEAGHRCVRCGHPYKPGTGEWGEAESKDEALQAEVGRIFYSGGDAPQPPAGIRNRAILWSPCDAKCHHTGPMRVWCRLQGGGEGWEPFDPTPEACGPAVEAVAPSPVQAAWRILTVHHLNEVKSDLRWWNLASLCQRCHLYIQRKVQMERVYPYEHSEWFKPYAAGWYAYAYLGEELSREQAMMRLDELLALERMV
jgi:hypothetical protein